MNKEQPPRRARGDREGSSAAAWLGLLLAIYIGSFGLLLRDECSGRNWFRRGIIHSWRRQIEAVYYPLVLILRSPPIYKRMIRFC